MRGSKKENRFSSAIWAVMGSCLFIVFWIAIKSIFDVSDRVLPSLSSVFLAIDDFEPHLLVHTLSTIQRLIFGFILAVAFGIILGISIYSNRYVGRVLMPTVQSFRAVPPIATVPFFILWFGFSETGRYLMIVFGIGFNIAVAVVQILSFVPEKYSVVFRSFSRKPHQLTTAYLIPRIVEELLPTLRFSLSAALGLVIVSELLGAQVGLGYLIQTSRSTYSMHVIFLAMIILGLINFGFDKIITLLWNALAFWKK